MKAVNLAERVRGRTILSLWRAALATKEGTEPQLDTIVIELEDRSLIELVRHEAGPRAYELGQNDSPLLDFELEPHEAVFKQRAHEPALPFRVDEVVELWAGQGSEAFVVGIVLRAAPGGIGVNICTETDELEVLSDDAFAERLRDIAEYAGHLEPR